MKAGFAHKATGCIVSEKERKEQTGVQFAF